MARKPKRPSGEADKSVKITVYVCPQAARKFRIECTGSERRPSKVFEEWALGLNRYVIQDRGKASGGGAVDVLPSGQEAA